MRGRGRALIGVAALLAAVVAVQAPALAADSNRLPPDVELWPGGNSGGIFGAAERTSAGAIRGGLAYFTTREPDESSIYPTGSSVTFTCLVDGAPVQCTAEHEPFEEVEAVAFRKAGLPGATVSCAGPASTAIASKPSCPLPLDPKDRPPLAKEGYGPFNGEVLSPPHLSPGRHTITVIASDEDGTDPSPPTTSIFLDLKKPSAPRLKKAPRRVGGVRKPRFRFVSTDNLRFPSKTSTSVELFDARLRRLRPPGPSLGMGDPFGNYLEWRGPRCPTPRRCTQLVWAAYSVSGEGGTSYGFPERLNPGLYEFRVRSRDQAGNRSPTTRYRFRIRGKRRR